MKIVKICALFLLIFSFIVPPFSWMHGCRSARAIHKIATPWLSAASQLFLLISWRSSHASTLAAFRASTKSALLDAWLNWCLKMYNDVVAHVYYGAFLGEGG